MGQATDYHGTNPVYWNKDVGSDQLSAVGGSAGFIANGATVFGTSGIKGIHEGVVDWETGDYHQVVNKRTAASACLTAMAGAAGGVAAFHQMAGPYGSIVGAVLGVAGTAMNGALGAIDSRKSIAALLQIQLKLEAPMTGVSADDLAMVSDVIDLCLDKMGTKRALSWGNALVIGQPLGALYRGARAGYKIATKQKGRQRATSARDLLKLAKQEGRASDLAREVIGVLVAKSFDQILQDTIADAMRSS